MARFGTSGGCSADTTARDWLPTIAPVEVVPPRIQERLQIACDLKREHPAWGAGLIRLQLREHAAQRSLPSVRSLRRAFIRAGVHRPRHRRVRTVVVPQAVDPHEIWQVDAVENVPLAAGQRICWLTVTDEVSGAILATEVSSSPPVGTRLPRRDPGMFRQVFVRWGRPDRVRVDNGYPWGSPRASPPNWRCG